MIERKTPKTNVRHVKVTIKKNKKRKKYFSFSGHF